VESEVYRMVGTIGMETTLNKIREYRPCKPGWEKLLSYLGKTNGDDEPLDFITLLDAVGIEDAIWCLRTQDYRNYCLFLADIVESVLPIYEVVGDSTAPRDAIQTIRDYHAGVATAEQLKKAADAAAAAAADVDAAAYAAAAVANAAAAAAAVAKAADAATDAAYAVANALYAVATYAARKPKWEEIESLYRKHFTLYGGMINEFY